MNLPEIEPYEDQAIDIVVSIVNRAKEILGERQTLKQFAISRQQFLPDPKVNISGLGSPLAVTAEALIHDVITRHWALTDMFKYHLAYSGMSQDECAQYYYFEAIFSQPTPAYPIPQATASVFFRVENKHILPPKLKGVPILMFRVEGQHTDHDVRLVRLPPAWLFAALQMKVKLFRRIEDLRLF